MTSTKLAAELAAIGRVISPDTIRKNWGKGAPRNSASAYIKWENAQAEKTSRADPGLRDLRAEKLRKEIELLTERHVAEQRENLVRSGELVSRALVRTDMHKAAARACAVLVQKFETELPPKQDGMPAAEIARLNREAIFEVRTILSQPGFYDT